jgi:hypothetical protein
MPGPITKYHRHFLPKGGHFAKEMSGIRKNRATQIKTLRNQLGRKKARATLVTQMKTHVAGVNEARRQKKVAAFRETHKPTVTQSPRWRKRGGGKVTVRKIPRLPKQLVKR